MSHLSIGEVLGLLLEEFPDVTISKIRFLESQGLIDPERTPSGYRKFYDDDVELLRCILREQRENYLPLRVIKDRLDSGEIDPTTETARPRGIKNLPVDDEEFVGSVPRPHLHPSSGMPSGAESLFARTGPAPVEAVPVDADLVDAGPVDAARLQLATDDDDPTRPGEKGDVSAPPVRTLASAPAPTAALLTRDELCTKASISAEALESLESYGVVSSVKGSGGLYGEDSLEIAAISVGFLDAGFDARHLRGWKVAADREAGLFEQMIQPLLRQRNPQAREQARQQLDGMARLGGELRTALMRAAMRHHHQD